MTILTVSLTLHNAGKHHIMIDNNHQNKDGFMYRLETGVSLKFAICYDLASDLKGSNRKADLKFFTDSSVYGRKYYQPVNLTQNDYDLFDLSSTESPVPLSYCFGVPPELEVLVGSSGSEYGYFGLRMEPYCSSTAAFCSTYSNLTNNNFLQLINTTGTYLFLPENRFDSVNQTFMNNLVYTPLNINNRYLRDTSAYEETLFVDQVRIVDDTQNWFMRQKGETTFSGVVSNLNTLMPLSRNIAGNPYYELKIKPSHNQINYIISTKKADFVIGIIGGVFVIWYALFHFIGKVYNSYNVRAKLAEDVYD